jgi:hypothetical protein
MLIRMTTAFLVVTTMALAETPKTPVVIELFTSEGCSSCPPADADLTRFVKEQPVLGAQIIPLAWHIDYWDRLGWRDPFSSQLATARQYQYKAALNLDTVYTPQLVVDGSGEMVGGDTKSATDAIAAAAKNRHVDVRLTIDPSNERVEVELGKLPADEPVQLLVAVTEDDLVSHPTRGENAGRKLKHLGVVRLMKSIGTVARSDTTFAREYDLKLDPAWHREQLKVVTFVQQAHLGPILAAKSIRLSR